MKRSIHTILQHLLCGAALLQIGLSAGVATAASCGESVPVAHAGGADGADGAVETAESQLLNVSDLANIRQGTGTRTLCRRIDGIDRIETRNVTLDDVRAVETAAGILQISAWEDDAERRVVSRGMLELGADTTRRFNAAGCPLTLTGRCSTLQQRRTRVRVQRSQIELQQTIYVNGSFSESVTWLLEH